MASTTATTTRTQGDCAAQCAGCVPECGWVQRHAERGPPAKASTACREGPRRRDRTAPRRSCTWHPHLYPQPVDRMWGMLARFPVGARASSTPVGIGTAQGVDQARSSVVADTPPDTTSGGARLLEPLGVVFTARAARWLGRNDIRVTTRVRTTSGDRHGPVSQGVER